MAEIRVTNGNIEDAIKRLKRQCARNEILQLEKENSKKQGGDFVKNCLFFI